MDPVSPSTPPYFDGIREELDFQDGHLGWESVER